MFIELILVCISCLIFSLYLTVYICNCGVPTSLSETYYKTEIKWLFSTVLSVCGALAIIPFMDSTPEPWTFLAFLSLASIFFIAASPAFKDSLVKSVHGISAYILAISVFAWLILAADFPLIALVGIIVGCFKRKQFIFWLEVGLLYDLYFNLICTISRLL